MARKKIGHVELQWTCPNCNTLNPGSEEHCISCGAPQPPDVEFTQADRQELITDGELIAKAEAGADFHCPYCGTRNPAGTEICSNCGGDLVEGMQRESGRVVGAFKSGPVQQITCPHCGESNPDTAMICASCGGSLAVKDQVRAQSVETGKPKSKARNWIIIGAIAVLAIACGLYLFFANRTQPTRGIVEDVAWERSIPIEAPVPVDHEDWEDEIPSEAELGACRQEVRSVQSEPAPDSVEVCGTPYTVDTGSGIGEVVQDCEYEVYAAFCTYTLQEWQVVDEIVASGSDFSPVWPEPDLSDTQRMAEEWDESYTILFASGGEIYRYTTSDLDLFQSFQLGSEWTLNINTFGNLVSVEQ